jgi:hypothetical protein
MPCTQQELDQARAAGIAEALRQIDIEIQAAAKEVEYANKDASTFSAGNRDRAVLRLDVLRAVRARVATCK